jgi:hypothetical protein
VTAREPGPPGKKPRPPDEPYPNVGRGYSPGNSRVRTRLLILWIAIAVVVWNGVFDMRMHDVVRGYLMETARARAGLGTGVPLRDYLREGRDRAIVFSTAWGGGVLVAGIVTIQVLSHHSDRTGR